MIMTVNKFRVFLLIAACVPCANALAGVQGGATSSGVRAVNIGTGSTDPIRWRATTIRRIHAAKPAIAECVGAGRGSLAGNTRHCYERRAQQNERPRAARPTPARRPAPRRAPLQAPASACDAPATSADLRFQWSSTSSRMQRQQIPWSLALSPCRRPRQPRLRKSDAAEAPARRARTGHESAPPSRRPLRTLWHVPMPTSPTTPAPNTRRMLPVRRAVAAMRQMGSRFMSA